VRRSKSSVANARSAAAGLVREHLSLQQLHGDEVAAFSFVNLVNRADIRMVERGRSEGLPMETLGGARIVLQVLRQKFLAPHGGAAQGSPLHTLRPSRRQRAARRCDSAKGLARHASFRSEIRLRIRISSVR
jgi:hypothetical protein